MFSEACASRRRTNVSGEEEPTWMEALKFLSASSAIMIGYEFVNLPDLFEKCGIDPHLDRSLWTIANNQIEGNVWRG